MITPERLNELIEEVMAAYDHGECCDYLAVASALRELAEMRWMPIESAPRGHKMFLVYSPTSQRAAVDYAFRDFTTDKIMVQSSGGWEPIEHFGGAATHWMPLPPPPKEQDK